MSKATQFQRALVDRSRIAFQTEVIEELVSEAEKRLAELGLEVKDLKIHARRAEGTVRVAWSVGERSRFSENFELQVKVPMAKNHESAKVDSLGETLRVVVAAFRRFGYEARMLVIPGPVYQPPVERYLEILLVKRGEFEAFLSCRV